MSIECREERVVEHGENLSFGLHVRKLLRGKGVSVDDLYGEGGGTAVP